MILLYLSIFKRVRWRGQGAGFRQIQQRYEPHPGTLRAIEIVENSPTYSERPQPTAHALRDRGGKWWRQEKNEENRSRSVLPIEAAEPSGLHNGKGWGDSVSFKADHQVVSRQAERLLFRAYCVFTDFKLLCKKNNKKKMDHITCDFLLAWI